MEILRTQDARTLASLNREVQELHHRLYPAEFKPFDPEAVTEAFEQFLQRETTTAFLAQKEGKPVGYVLTMVLTREANAFQYKRIVLNVDQLVVLPEFRQQGIARALLEDVEAYATDLGIHKLILDHWHDNTDAASFFQKQGFTYYNHRMEKDLI